MESPSWGQSNLVCGVFSWKFVVKKCGDKTTGTQSYMWFQKRPLLNLISWFNSASCVCMILHLPSWVLGYGVLFLFLLFVFFYNLGPMRIWLSSLEVIPVFVNDTYWHCYSIQPRWRLSKRTTLKMKATLFFSITQKFLSSLLHLIWSNDHFFLVMPYALSFINYQ